MALSRLRQLLILVSICLDSSTIFIFALRALPSHPLHPPLRRSKMVKFYDQIEPDLAEWAMKQQVFFVASAPLKGRHINVSPKGLPSSSFCILNPNLCAYVDATGSGIETVSHMQENGRCTVMFCSFDTSPRIMRFFCTGRVVAWNEPGFDGWLTRMGNKNLTGARAVIVLDVFKVGFLLLSFLLLSDLVVHVCLLL